LLTLLGVWICGRLRFVRHASLLVSTVVAEPRRHLACGQRRRAHCRCRRSALRGRSHPGAVGRQLLLDTLDRPFGLAFRALLLTAALAITAIRLAVVIVLVGRIFLALRLLAALRLFGLVVVARAVLLHLLGLSAVLELFRVAELDVRLEASEVCLDRALHE